MRSDLTDITLIVDRSGSMSSCLTDAQGGINTFIEDQKKQPGEAIFSLLQFDTEYEWKWKGIPIKDAAEYVLEPRGLTALLDAVGRAIAETGERLKKMEEKDRPGLVVIAIVTDGEENSSKEYKKKQIKEMITLQKDTYKWQFTFLGANQDAFAEAGGIGIPLSAVLNYDPKKSIHTYAIASNNVSRMRSASMSGEAIVNTYTSEERESVQ